jgi:hypothetical protein
MSVGLCHNIVFQHIKPFATAIQYGGYRERFSPKGKRYTTQLAWVRVVV